MKDTRKEVFLRVYSENIIVVVGHYISKNFNVNLSHSLISLIKLQ